MALQQQPAVAALDQERHWLAIGAAASPWLDEQPEIVALDMRDQHLAARVSVKTGGR